MESPSESESIIDEQRIWKKNTKLFYNLLISHRLQWPSLSVEWLRYRGEEKSLGYCTHRIVYGTFTSSEEPEQLIVDAVKVPYDEITEKQTESITKKENLLSNIVSMGHHSESNRIRVNPSNDYIIASKSANNNIYVYNYENVSKGSEKGLKNILEGHAQEGFGLAWNSENLLASASNDKLVCYWDCNSNISQPIRSYTHHSEAAEDVAWCNNFTIGSVGDDKKIFIVDTRTHQVANEVLGHSGNINSIDFHKNYSELLVTASSDQTIAIWDLRNMSDALRRLNCNAEVFSAKFAPFGSGLLASTGGDNKVHIWNLGKEAPLRFTHEGHFCRVNEFSWNPSENLVIASVDEENYLQVWMMHPDFLN